MVSTWRFALPVGAPVARTERVTGDPGSTHAHALKRIKIHAPELSSGLPSPLPHGVWLSFAAAPDSFYTLWSHLAQNDPNPQSTDARSLYTGSQYFARVQKISTLAVWLMKICINVSGSTSHGDDERPAAWYPGMNWQLTYFAPVASPALVLGRLFGRFYAPTNSTIYDPPPLDELTLVDRYLSTKTLEVDDDGVTISKADKLVYARAINDVQICSACATPKSMGCKIVVAAENAASMTTLEMAGTLSQYKTFRLPFTRAHLWGMRAGKSGPLIYDVRNKAHELKRSDVVFDLNVALALNGVRWKLQRGRNTLQALRNPSLVQ